MIKTLKISSFAVENESIDKNMLPVLDSDASEYLTCMENAKFDCIKIWKYLRQRGGSWERF